MDENQIVNQVMVIAEKESLLVRVLLKKLQEAGIKVVFSTLDVNAINEEWADSTFITFFMDTGVSLPSDVQVFLADKMEEDGKKMILVGDKSDLELAEKEIPRSLIYRQFQRPLDNELFVRSAKELLGKIESGEFQKSILIVDDDPTYLGLVREWLKEFYRVSVVSSGLQAIKWLGKNKADLILLDHEMPVTSGPQVLEMLRSDEDTKSIPVIFLTGKSDKQSVMSVVALKPEGYLLKTISKVELIEKLEEFFMLRR